MYLQSALMIQLSFNVELEAKFIAKSLALYNNDEISSGPFMIVRTDTVFIKNFVRDFPEVMGFKFLLLTLVWNACI